MRSAVQKLGILRPIEPQAALLEELHRSAGAVAVLDVFVGDRGVTGDDAPAYVQEWNVQRRQYLEVAKACVSVGIAEQRIQLEQDQARMVAVAVSEGLDAIGADPGQREVFTRVLLARMRLVDGSTVAGEVEA